ncbi:uncharacterized protein LOC131224966 [Magnolia sinica]|uniref:uncharacterized protein LOC131224966 n=1 Tax=Magnolia sinica TaxID=86752 RepID=UPI002657C46A|nr:uncharacterized protein LOC131224966 [Magnolia sinica]
MTSEEFIENLNTALRCFEAVSGLSINMSKFKLFRIHLSVEEVNKFSNILGCPSVTFPSSYVGLPLVVGSPTKAVWDKVVDKVQKALATWKCRYLSIGGRMTLIKAALSNIPTYFTSLLKCPPTTGKDNQKKLHLLDWKEVCKHYQEGGASIKNLRLMNQALLGKWIWRLGTEGDALRNLIIKGKYGSSQGGWWTKELVVTRASLLWKAIMRTEKEVVRNIAFELGNGNRIRF